MNRDMVLYVIGRIMLVLALLMLPSLLVSLIYHESSSLIFSFLLSIGITGTVGRVLSLRLPSRQDYYMREGFVIVALSWILLSFFGSLPFIFSGYIASPASAFFETASGFTTTGASILTEVLALPRSLLFWRSFTHLIGGMGILVFALAVMPRIENDDVFIMRAEVPGPTFGKLHARVRGTARILYSIYLSLTALVILLLVLGGMPLFDAVCNAFGAAGTGGFAVTSTSIAAYNSAYAELVLAISMLVFGSNFALIYALLKGHIKEVLKSEELRWYLGIVAASCLLICANLWPYYHSPLRLLRDVFFTVSSIITTTGYSTVDFDLWPLFSKLILLFLMFVGGMAGSTAGGLKVSRIAIYTRASLAELGRNISPNRCLPLRFEGKTLGQGLQTRSVRYLLMYILLFLLFLLFIAPDSPDFISAFSAVAATFNNIGPGFGIVGPSRNFAQYHAFSQIVLSLSMIMGRLEIFPILVLFSPRAWKRN